MHLISSSFSLSLGKFRALFKSQQAICSLALVDIFGLISCCHKQ